MFFKEIFLLGSYFLCLVWSEQFTFYSLSATDIISMESVEMSKYKGKVLLVVNVASECGYTDTHYRELVDLQRSFPADQFQVLAFPCNQFGKQEPKNNKFISKFATESYHVNFPMFGKIKTIGQYSHPIYKWLKKETKIEPDWNFSKFLVDKRGKVKRFAPAQVSPMQMSSDIQKLVSDQEIVGGFRMYESHHDEL